MLSSLSRISQFAFVVLLCALATLTAQAGEVVYKKDIVPKQFNDVWNRMFDTDFLLRYDQEGDVVTVYFEDGISMVGFTLPVEARSELRALLEKYMEWDAKAKDMEVKLDKEIGEFESPAGYWRMGDEGTVLISV